MPIPLTCQSAVGGAAGDGANGIRDGDEQSTTLTHLPDSQTMVSTSTREAVSSITLQGVTFGPALKSTSTVNSITVSESWQSVDGRSSGCRSFGNESLTQRTLPSGGAWTVTSTAPDGTKSIQSYSDGLLNEAKQFNNAGTAPGNLVASVSYTYDIHGRPSHHHRLAHRHDHHGQLHGQRQPALGHRFREPHHHLHL